MNNTTSSPSTAHGQAQNNANTPPKPQPAASPAAKVDSLLEKRLGIRLSPPPGKYAIEIMFELAGLAAAVAFGVFAIRSVNDANKANQYATVAIQQALTANQLALLAFCLSNYYEPQKLNAVCSRVLEAAVTAIPSAATVLFSPLPLETSTTTTTATSYVTTTETQTTILDGTTTIATITTTFIASKPPTSTSSFNGPTSSSGPSSSTFSSISTSPTSAFSTPTPSPTGNLASSARHSNTGLIAGLVVGLIVGLSVLSIGVSLLGRRRTRGTGNEMPSMSAEAVGPDPFTRPARIDRTQAPSRPQYAQSGNVTRGTVASRFRDLFLDSKVTHID